MRRQMQLALFGVTILAVGCSGGVDIADIPLGADVQLTRDDGALVEGTLAERDETTVTIDRGPVTKEVPVAQIADVRVVPADEPAPEPPPMARFREVTLPADTALAIELRSTVDTGTSREGDVVEAVLTDAIVVDQLEALPAGAVVRGRVAAVQSSGKMKGRASVALVFDQVVARDQTYEMSARFEAVAPSTTGDDVKRIGIPAAGGAILGAVMGGGKGAAIGAAIGGGAGTVAALMTDGGEIRLAEGTTLSVPLQAALDVRIPIVK
ncbi:MAG TPA: hypothetical protein VMM93_09220 [Vicinamibacterales bacterium]|nr:hypothetical protein [Vicinamibacterales bacterium]